MQAENQASTATSVEFRGSDIPKVPAYRFEPSNSIFIRHIAAVVMCIQGEVIVCDGWTLLGVCESLGNQMDRKDSVCLLLWNDQEGEVWQHYPRSGFEHLVWRGRLDG